MFSFFNGKIVLATDKYVIIEVNGVGYKVYVPQRILHTISKKDDLVKLFTHTIVNMNDGTFDIYGFTNPEDLHVFLMLTSVSGVGPSLANGIISAMDAKTVQSAILSEDHDFLSTIPRVGKKTAQRIIIDLKTKVDALPGIETEKFKSDIDIIDALVGLGYTKFQAQEALGAISKKDIKTPEDRIKEALKVLGKK